MFRFNDRCKGRHIDQFIKNVPIEPCTEYVLSFDSLGGAVGCWINKCFVRPGKAYYFDRCPQWTTHTVRFTTSDNLEKQAAFENWGISFFKKMNSHYITGIEDTHIDNVQLCKAVAPETSLIPGGDFEAEPDSDVYAAHWSAFLGAYYRDLFGIGLVCDPLDSRNRCLKLPGLIQPPVYSAPQPLEVRGVGYYRDISPVDLQHRDAVGLPHHLLLFAERGEIVFRGDHAFSVPAGSGVYLPSGTPAHLKLCRGKNTAYFWISFSGASADTLIRQAGVVPMQPFTLASSATVTAHVDELLQFPTDSAFYPHAASGHLQLILAQLSLHRTDAAQTEQERLIRRVAARLREQPELPADNADLADSCGFSVGHFIRLFKQTMGCTPHQYHLQMLMQRACALLRETTLSVQEIALSLGVDNPLYFSNQFRRIHGASPSEYRRLHTK